MNFDASLRLRIENFPVAGIVMKRAGLGIFPPGVLYGNIVAGLPVADGSASGVYCSHVLEHLERESLVLALGNTLKMLKPGGTFRLVVPDLEWRARELVKGFDSGLSDAADIFMRNTMLGTETRPAGFMAKLRDWFGLSAHLWMYDERSMMQCLRDSGFVSLRRCSFNDAAEPQFALVENRLRFFEGNMRELAIEAKRPG